MQAFLFAYRPCAGLIIKILGGWSSAGELLDKNYAARLRRYIERHTTWRIQMHGSLRPRVQLIFGELFVVVKFQSQQLRVKFADIENF